MKNLVIAVDFDGTVVSHDYPEVGKDIGAAPILKELLERGHELVLFTMRSGKHLHDAIEWFSKNNIRLYGIQYNPTQAQWTCSNKCYAHIYIDDAALGCPLLDPIDGKRSYVDWRQIRQLLKEKGVL